MQKFINLLDNIKIASPCPADWSKMYGDERKRFCSDCKLNVYNLSDMSKQEAENFLINSEGRVCIKFYKRKDGTVLTKDCPIGWQNLKKRVSHISTAIFAFVLGFFGGIFAFQQTQLQELNLLEQVTIEIEDNHLYSNIPTVDEIENLDETKDSVKEEEKMEVVGLYDNIRRLEDEPVIAWIQ